MQEGEQCSHGVQGEGSGRTGMGEVLVGTSLKRVPPAASTPSWSPLVILQSHEVLLGAASLRAFKRVSPQLQGGEGENEGT